MKLARIHPTLTLTTMVSLALTVLPSLARADFMDAVKNVASKPEVQAAAKKAGNQAVEAGKKTVAKDVVAKLEKELNTRLMAEAQKNQCSFKSDSDQLEPGCDKKAQNLATAVINAKKQITGAGITGFKFEVSGHTDTRGNAAHNKELSGKRAEVMVKELVARGVSKEEIISIGMGAEKPLVKPDNTPAKQAKNRRYELRVRL